MDIFHPKMFKRYHVSTAHQYFNDKIYTSNKYIDLYDCIEEFEFISFQIR